MGIGGKYRPPEPLESVFPPRGCLGLAVVATLSLIVYVYLADCRPLVYVPRPMKTAGCPSQLRCLSEPWPRAPWPPNLIQLVLLVDLLVRLLILLVHLLIVWV
jgi:hypothetical protein